MKTEVLESEAQVLELIKKERESNGSNGCMVISKNKHFYTCSHHTAFSTLVELKKYNVVCVEYDVGRPYICSDEIKMSEEDGAWTLHMNILTKIMFILTWGKWLRLFRYTDTAFYTKFSDDTEANWVKNPNFIVWDKKVK